MERPLSKVMQDALKVVASVKCSVCGAVHSADGDDFITIYGDITIGAKEQVLNTNFNDKGKLVGTTIVCRNKTCGQKVIAAFEPKKVMRDGAPAKKARS